MKEVDADLLAACEELLLVIGNLVPPKTSHPSLALAPRPAGRGGGRQLPAEPAGLPEGF